MKILLTGASGMVGRNFMASSGMAHHELLYPHHGELDLLDRAAVRTYLGREKPDLVIHCAARVGGIEANRRCNSIFLAENALLGLHVIQEARAVGIPRLINITSSCMYPKDMPNRLETGDLFGGPLEPTNEGYAIAKLMSLRLAEYISMETPEFSYKTLIPCNLYGSWDKFDPLRAHLIPSIIRKIHEAKRDGHKGIEIWGDGMARREFLFTEDLVKFMVLAIDRWADLPQNINVGYGEDFSILDYYRMACDAIGFPAEFHFDLTRPVGMKRKLLDSQEAFALGWKPIIEHQEGIRRTYAHFLERQA